MPKPASNSDAAYAKLAAHFLKLKGVTQSDKFGKGLRLNEKVFAMTVKGELVVKLPEERVVDLIKTKTGKSFMHGKKIMKEWLVMPLVEEQKWLTLAKEAHALASEKST